MPTSNVIDLVRGNWQRVQAEVNEAVASAGRGDDVTVVGVTKYVGPELTYALYQVGCRILGENRPQSLWEKYDWCANQGLEQPEWHLIGHLQRNKVRRTLPMLACVQSVDSLRIAQTLNAEAARIGEPIQVLIEVNVTDDEEKTGMRQEELKRVFDLLPELAYLKPTGLMAMSTHHADAQQLRSEFARVRELRDSLEAEFPGVALPDLSMGMSGDFREAIMEGATLVRIGSSLWEGIERDR